MKKLFSCLLIMTLLTGGCSKEDLEREIYQQTSDGPSVESICKSNGIFPKDIASITSINFVVDSVSYKLAGGAKGNKSWFAKFSPDGTELYSYSLAPNIAQKEYAFITTDQSETEKNCNYRIDNNLSFIITFFINKDDDIDSFSGGWKSVLSVLDFETGKELSILPVEDHINRYTISRSNDT